MADVESNIMREPTDAEKRDFIPLNIPKRRERDAKGKFEDELAKHLQEASIKRLPFAEKAARDDFYDYYGDIVKVHTRKYGYVKTEEIKPIKMVWDKYCDLKNFEIVEEGERQDEHLSRIHPGIAVMIKYTKYKFKGYDNVYWVNETADTAIARAKKKAKE